MRTIWVAMCAVGLLVGARVGQSGEQPDARAVIDKGIKARGGEANLNKHKAVVLKGGGKYYGLGEGIPYTGEWSIQPPGQIRVVIEGKVNNQTFRMIRVVDGDKGWAKLNDGETKSMSKEEVAEQREELYANWVANLVPLKDKAYQLAPLGESKVDGRDAVGVRVSHKGHRDVTLFFDKASGLLVKTETVVKDVEGGGDKEMTQEVFRSDFKEIDGFKHAMKAVLKRDGKLFVEVEWSEVRPAEKLEDSVFARP